MNDTASYKENEIDKMRNLYLKYKSQVEEMKLVSDAILDKFISELHRTPDVTALHFNFYLQNKNKNKKLLKSVLDDNFGKQEWLFDSVIFCGYEKYGYMISFLKNGKKYCIRVPFFRNITKENAMYIDYGMFSLLEEDDHGNLSMVFFSYDICQIKEYIERNL